MAAPVSVRLRQEVAERAAYRCEYCGLPQRFALHAQRTSLITLCRVSMVERVICRTWRGRACGAIGTKVPTWARLIQKQGGWCLFSIHAPKTVRPTSPGKEQSSNH
jgi:hypothetical protein